MQLQSQRLKPYQASSNGRRPTWQTPLPHMQLAYTFAYTTSLQKDKLSHPPTKPTRNYMPLSTNTTRGKPTHKQMPVVPTQSPSKMIRPAAQLCCLAFIAPTRNDAEGRTEIVVETASSPRVKRWIKAHRRCLANSLPLRAHLHSHVDFQPDRLHAVLVLPSEVHLNAAFRRRMPPLHDPPREVP